MSEVSDTKTSGTSLISSINQSGSGIDLSNLVDGLVTAETFSKQESLTEKVEATNLQISSYGQLNTKLDTLSSSLSTLESTTARTTASSSTAVSLTVTNEAIAKDINADITVSSVAQGQVVTFDLTHSSLLNSNTLSSSSSIDTGSIAFVMNGATTTITIGSSNNTLQGLVDEINKISGAQASLIDTTGSGGLSLSIKSDTGTANAFSLTSSDGLNEFNTSGMTSSSTPIKLSVASANAVFTVDGLSVTRSSNLVSDLFSGQTLNINAVSASPVNVESAVVTSNATVKMQSFVESINSLKTYLTAETKRGLNGGTAGSLAGDFAAQSVLSELRSITTQEITGYGSSSFYLANVGIKTERDGTLSLDTAKFEAAIAADPDLVNIVFSSKYSSTSDKVAVTGSANYPPVAGSYSFNFTASSGAGSLNSEALSGATNSSGNKVFRGTTGDANGMAVEVLNATADISGTVRFGQSIIDKLQVYIKDIKSSTGILSKRNTSLNENLAKYEIEQTELDEKIQSLTDQYNVKFGKMESLVTQLNKTGEYLTSMMDAWNKKD